MIRRLNFTGRRRLSRSEVSVRLKDAGQGTMHVTATLLLEKHNLPPLARVFVEAYRQTSWQRFDFGTVQAPRRSEPAVLSEFGTAQGVRFRVRVVEPERPGRPPRILAFVDDLKPVAAPGKEGGASLLPVDWGDLAERTWKLELDEDTGPLLRVSRKLVSDREAFIGSREFASLVLPEILERILERVLLRESGVEDEGAEGWAVDWLRLISELPDVAGPPRREGAHSLTDDEEDWIESVVEAFSKAHGVAGRFRAWWDAGLA
jgi:hypothetical protein